MTGYWPKIPPLSPYNNDIRTSGYSIKDRNAKQHDKILQQYILKKIILNIHFMCKKLQRYGGNSQIECKKERLVLEELFNKKRLERERI